MTCNLAFILLELFGDIAASLPLALRTFATAIRTIPSGTTTPGCTHQRLSTYVTSFHTALLVCASLAALGIFTALARGKEAVAKKVKMQLP